MTDEIENAALALPRGDRARLAQRLIESLDEEAELTAAWEQEIDRRLDAYDRGEANSHDGADVLRELRAQIAKK